jgi:hypothetical protein
MRRFGVKPWVLLLAGFGLLWLPAPVRAECGDYVTTESDSHSTAHPDKKQTRPVQTPCSRSHPSDPGAPRPDQPCRGPNCSGSPAPAMPLTVSPQRINPEQALSILDLMATSGADGHRLSVPQDSLPSTPLTSILFRPPRTGTPVC